MYTRKAIENSRNSVQWSKVKDESITVPVHISGAAFIPTLYRLFGWNNGVRYKLIGNAHTKNDETILTFDAKEAYAIEDNKPAYPSRWADSFGDEYYKSQALYDDNEPDDENWEIEKPGALYKSAEDNVTSQEDAAKNITSILGELGVREDE